MPTYKTVTVASSGGDYTSLNAALSTEATDLTAQSGDLVINCQAFADTTQVNTSGQSWTTDATHRVIIQATDTPTSVGWDTGRYRLDYSGAAGTAFVLAAGGIDHCAIYGIQVRHSNAGNAFLLAGGATAGDYTVEECLAIADDSCYLVRGDGSTTVKMHNCVGTAPGGRGIWVQNNNGNVTCYFDSGTLHDAAAGYRGDTGVTLTMRNTRVTGMTAVKDAGSNIDLSASSDYNLTDDASAPTNWGSNSVTSATLDYVDADNATVTSRDFALDTGSDSGYQAGTSLSGDANNPFPDDFLGNTRSGTWDIGAHELSINVTVSPAEALHAHAADNATVSEAGSGDPLQLLSTKTNVQRNTASTAALTGSHTTDANTNLLVLVVNYGYQSSSTHAQTVTFDGNALTEIATAEQGNDARVDIWYLKNPGVKTATVSVGSFGGGAMGGGWTAYNFANADVSGTTFGTYQSKTAITKDCTVTLSSAVDEIIVGGSSHADQSGTFTPETGVTERFEWTASISQHVTGTMTGATSATFGWQHTGSSQDAAVLAVPVKPATAGGGDDHTVTPADAQHAHTADQAGVFEEGSAPAAPTGATIDSKGSDSITASFTDNTGGVNRHRAYYKASASSEWILAAQLGRVDTDFTFYFLSPSTAYDIGFTSYDAGSESPMTTASTTTFAPLAPADALHAHAADNATLIAVSDSVLIIQDTLHGHSAHNVSLDGGAGITTVAASFV